MNQVQVKIVQLKALKACVNCRFHVVFLSMPKLASNEEIFALDTSCEAFLERLADFFFIAVHLSAVNVSVAINKNRLFDNFDKLAFIRLECSKTDNWDLEA